MYHKCHHHCGALLATAVLLGSREEMTHLYLCTSTHWALRQKPAHEGESVKGQKGLCVSSLLGLLALPSPVHVCLCCFLWCPSSLWFRRLRASLQEQPGGSVSAAIPRADPWHTLDREKTQETKRLYGTRPCPPLADSRCPCRKR